MENQYKNYLDNARQVIASGLNAYLSEERLDPVTGFVTSAFDLSEELMIAVYPASPSAPRGSLGENACASVAAARARQLPLALAEAPPLKMWLPKRLCNTDVSYCES